MIEEWYSYREFGFTPEQIAWALRNHACFRAGTWPVEPKETGYIGAGKGRSYRAEASFIRTKVIWAEIQYRLAMAGTDREYIEKSYCYNWEDIDIARYYNRDEWEIRRGIDNAMSYISSGWCRRWVECSREHCPRFARCRKPKKFRRQTVSYQGWCYRRNARVKRK